MKKENQNNLTNNKMEKEETEIICGNCRFYEDGKCFLMHEPTDEYYVCEEHES